MKVGILAGGKGTRLIEETQNKPKPMVEIGGKPILWHILMYYFSFGFNHFVVAIGYKGIKIKTYMENHCSAIEEDASTWNVAMIDTGISTRTGGRIKRLAPYLGDETFMLTWSDGLSNINLNDLLDFHRSHGKLATLTAVHPPERFGRVELNGNRVVRFSEKPKITDRWINGAFFVLEPGVFEYIADDSTQWEHEPLKKLARDGQLMAYRHTDFWQCMDTLHDKYLLEELWQSGKAPWKTWE